jgi:tartrate-resistant acid phosphatase type 5
MRLVNINNGEEEMCVRLIFMVIAFSCILYSSILLATNNATTFAALGDYGVAYYAIDNTDFPTPTDPNNEKAVANLIKRWKVNHILALGDNSYPHGYKNSVDYNVGQFYSNYIYPYKTDYDPNTHYISNATSNMFWPLLGNHDYNVKSSLPDISPYLSYFTLDPSNNVVNNGNERYYTFTKGTVQFFVLNTEAAVEPDGTTFDGSDTKQYRGFIGSKTYGKFTGNSITQYQWFLTQVKASRAKWKIALLHSSPYSSGFGGSQPPGRQWPFAQMGIDAVISADVHNYERLIVDNIPYIISGLGGAKISPFGDAPKPPLKESRVRYDKNFGALKIEANENYLTFTFYSVDNVIQDTYRLSPASNGGGCGHNSGCIASILMSITNY